MVPGRQVQLQHEAQPAEEGLVDVVDEVGGEDDDAGEPLDVVEENSHVHVGIAVRGGARVSVCVCVCVCVHVYTCECINVCA